jgi:hypothetical protein
VKIFHNRWYIEQCGDLDIGIHSDLPIHNNFYTIREEDFELRQHQR